MRVLVTGGGGYIGSHAARQLSRCGHEVVIFDNHSTSHRVFADGFYWFSACFAQIRGPTEVSSVMFDQGGIQAVLPNQLSEPIAEARLAVSGHARSDFISHFPRSPTELALKWQ